MRMRSTPSVLGLILFCHYIILHELIHVPRNSFRGSLIPQLPYVIGRIAMQSASRGRKIVQCNSKKHYNNLPKWHSCAINMVILCQIHNWHFYCPLIWNLKLVDMGIKPGPKRIAKSTGKPDRRQRDNKQTPGNTPSLKPHIHKKGDWKKRRCALCSAVFFSNKKAYT